MPSILNVIITLVIDRPGQPGFFEKNLTISPWDPRSLIGGPGDHHSKNILPRSREKFHAAGDELFRGPERIDFQVFTGRSDR